MKEIRYKYEERTIELFYHFGINNPFNKYEAYEHLLSINSRITINAVKNTLERIIWTKYIEEDTYDQWYWQAHLNNGSISTIPSLNKKVDNSMMSIFIDRDLFKGVDKRKNYYRFSPKVAYNLIQDFNLDVDNEIKKIMTKGLLLDK